MCTCTGENLPHFLSVIFISEFRITREKLQRSTCVGLTFKKIPNYVQILPPVVLAASEVLWQTTNPTSQLGSGFHLITKYSNVYLSYLQGPSSRFDVNHDLIWPVTHLLYLSSELSKQAQPKVERSNHPQLLYRTKHNLIETKKQIVQKAF